MSGEIRPNPPPRLVLRSGVARYARTPALRTSRGGEA
jgi:hypothetical protein